MSLLKFSSTTVLIFTAAALTGCVSNGNYISSEGFSDPTSEVILSWGDLPDGRTWGSSAGIDIDPTDGHIWAYERCAAGGSLAGPNPVNCDNNLVDPVFKFDRHTGEILANFGSGIMVFPHGLHVDTEGNVWVTDFAANAAGTKGQQVHKFSPTGELLMSLGTAGSRGNGPNQFNQPNDVIVGPDGSIYVADGHGGQVMTSIEAMEAGRARGATARIIKFSPDGRKLKEWGRIGVLHGEFRTPHALEFDSQGRLWVSDRGNHRLEIFDQEGNYLESRYSYGRSSGLFITDDDMVYSTDSESTPMNHTGWRAGVRIGPLNEDRIVAFIQPHDFEDREYQGIAGEGVAVDADGNVFGAEGPISLPVTGGPFTKYVAR
jgi:sugar lactone lactonase YvrE